ncbi:peroxiredoxin-like family protein [Sporichthya sp.]|uniref:peroxiredoxin-like family protein n=1 Tax=Sporichthya sp. TaxID=65475 RepID=UPI0017DCA179|nr:peroxiredoxin-like family protein [Sporichthya sp.]MBA3742372.1 AhpC/TSA family protein [Sporichthya sp.]
MTTSMTERVAAFEAKAAAEFPADALAVFGGERVFQGAKCPLDVPAPGTPMPDGELLDAHGNPTTLAAARAGKPAVVVFYRGAWCPYCNLTLRAYQEDLLAELTARGVGLVAISPQKPDGALSAQETNQLSYAVLSDPGNQIAGALGILTETGEAAVAVAAQLGLVVADTNADGTAAIPMPTVVMLDAAGAIQWIDVHPDYGTRTEPTEILKHVADLTG